MTLQELHKMLASEPMANANLEMKVWLPGSSISLHSNGTLIRRGNVLMIEGSVDDGSVLADMPMENHK
jgi:hypothetical protein